MNPKWKTPPREKVHEALSAVLDERVSIVADNRAEVWSSDRSKRYSVVWSADQRGFGSNDNASFYQGYIGYPIIAVLLKLEILPFRPEVCGALRDVPWKAINKKHKNNYANAVDEVLSERLTETGSRQDIETYIDEVFAKLISLDLSRERSTGRPPS